MTLYDFLAGNLHQTVMINLNVDEKEYFQYNYWNFLPNINQLHLLKDDLTIGHILHDGKIKSNEDGSISYDSKYFPKQCKINFYYGGVTP